MVMASSWNHAELLGAQIAERFPDQELELVDGGQPHYHYILSVE